MFGLLKYDTSILCLEAVKFINYIYTTLCMHAQPDNQFWLEQFW